ncbi:MAG TPA: L,D-transpeptidase [Stellaceae bacterium]|jgi:lipoprotein-anchoring transpeptidase ErfK/SrfK|nr:L,D-transpeptidase [Stellaceae bacterium]
MRLFRRLSLALAFAAASIAAGAAQARDVVPFPSQYRPGDIVIMTNARQLFFVLDSGRAIRYPVGVGKAGMAWHGRAYVALKRLRPAWQAPPEIAGGGYGPVIPGGSPRNPMGAAVLGLDRGNYAIHGTNNPPSVGGFVSHGCIRMYNEDVLDLYARVSVGTEVLVLR